MLYCTSTRMPLSTAAAVRVQIVLLYRAWCVVGPAPTPTAFGLRPSAYGLRPTYIPGSYRYTCEIVSRYPTQTTAVVPKTRYLFFKPSHCCNGLHCSENKNNDGGSVFSYFSSCCGTWYIPPASSRFPTNEQLSGLCMSCFWYPRLVPMQPVS